MPSVRSSAAAALLAIAASAASAADKPVNITADLPAVEVKHEGRTVRIERNPDNLNQIDADFALTSRPYPPYCVQPMQIAPGVETIGELEVLDYLRRMSAGDGGIMLIDSREKEWLQRSGVIPGAVSIPWNELHPAQAETSYSITLPLMPCGFAASLLLFLLQLIEKLPHVFLAPGS